MDDFSNDIFLFNAHEIGDDGLVGIGGDLASERIIAAYKKGIFPWEYTAGGAWWFSPNPRCVLYPEKIFVSKSMQKVMASDIFHFKIDHSFEAVVRNCRDVPRPGQDGTWINDSFIESALQLHKMGVAHSFEAWQGDELVGGFYGMLIDTLFCGESMFSKVSNASKAALIFLCRQQQLKIDLIDCQVVTNHLLSMGAEAIPRDEYLLLLQNKFGFQ